MKDLLSNYERIKDILSNVYGMNSLVQGNNIVVYQNGQEIGTIDGRLESGSIYTRDFSCLFFDSNTSVKHYKPLEGANALARIGDKGERKLGTRGKKCGEISVEINSEFIAISKFTKDEKSGARINELCLISALSSGEIKSHHTILKSGISEYVVEDVDNTTCFVKNSISKLREINPNGIDNFLRASNPILYKLIERTILDEDAKSISISDDKPYEKYKEYK